MVVNDKFIHHHQSQQRLRYRAASAISTSGCSCSSNRDSRRELPANPMIKSWPVSLPLLSLSLFPVVSPPFSLLHDSHPLPPSFSSPSFPAILILSSSLLQSSNMRSRQVLQIGDQNEKSLQGIVGVSPLHAGRRLVCHPLQDVIYSVVFDDHWGEKNRNEAVTTERNKNIKCYDLAQWCE